LFLYFYRSPPTPSPNLSMMNILKKGSEKARIEASNTITEVRKAMKIDYF